MHKQHLILKLQLRRIFIHSILLCIVCIYSCVPAVDNTEKLELHVDFDKKAIQDIWDNIDHRNMDSIRSYLSDKDPNKRLLAVRGLFTIRDSMIIDSLAYLLNDPFEEIRESAAFALGQSGHLSATKYLIQAFDSQDSLAGQRLFNKYLLEAVGKTGDAESEKNIAGVNTYASTDDMLIEGQAMALYQFALRKITSQSAVDKVIEILTDPNNTDRAKLYAAHYLSRTGQISLKNYDEQLRDIGINNPDPNIRIAIASAFKNLKDDFGFQSLKDWYREETDNRVKAVLLRSLFSYVDRDIEDIILETIKDEDTKLATLASERLSDYITPAESVNLRRRTKASVSKPWPVRSNMYLAANKMLSNNYRISKENMNNEIEQQYRSAKSPYAKAAYIKAWAQYGNNLDKVINEYNKTKSSIIKTTIIETLMNLASPKDINTIYAGMQNTAKTKIAELIKKGISSGDPSTIAMGCSNIFNNYKTWKPFFRNYDFVKSAMDSLDLPKDYEAYYEAKKLYNKSINKEEIINKPEFNHPIDWTWVSDLPDTVHVKITMESGDILCHLYKQHTPGTVANFVQLAVAEFYNGKAFHRVVPSFVAQAGCPIGNGFGSLDYSIRSEFTPLYYDRPGRIGMASLGSDTEGTQWFITHTATPHLDGRYTIFGQVVNGMSVVNDLNMGDIIKEVKILNL